MIFPKTSTEETIRFVSYFIAEFQFIVYQLRLKKKRNNSWGLTNSLNNGVGFWTCVPSFWFFIDSKKLLPFHSSEKNSEIGLTKASY